jgi:signal transduction histidine kinase/phage shock protein PspC (stress-responsive transcriptional regulator)
MTIEPTTLPPRPPEPPAKAPGPRFAYPPRRLYRDRDGRIVAGVAAGVAEHLRLPAVVVRVAFVALLAANGLGALLYIGFWAVLPVAPRGTGRRRPPGAALQAIGLFALALGVILLQLQFEGTGLDATLVGLITLVALGAGIIWHQTDPQRRRREVDPSRANAWRRAVEGETEGVRRWYLVRVLGGGLLIIIGIIGILGFFAPIGNVDYADVLLGLIFSLLALAGLVLTLAPLLNRVIGQLREERVARIREQERAEVAAMVHDQVLHTLALIQRNSADAASVVRLARGQERSLRNWLYKPSASPTERLAPALEQAAAEVEDAFAITVETVIVGDAENDEGVTALVAATREALVNAARHAKVGTVSLYAEAEEETLSVYVRDRGVGFDMSTMDDDRHGVRGSIIGRMHRHGGRAQVRSAPGEGTEIELTLPRTRVVATEGRQ